MADISYGPDESADVPGLSRVQPAASRIGSRTLSIRLRLVLLIASVAIPLLLLALFIAVRYADAERRVVEAQRYDVANNLTYLLQRDIERVKGVLWSLAASPDLAEGRLDVFRRHAEATAKLAGIDAITLFNASGDELASTAAAPLRLRQGTQLLDGAFDGRTTVSGVTNLGDGTRPVFLISVPVARRGGVFQALNAVLSVEPLSRLFDEAGMSRDWVAAIVDSKGIFLARSRDPDKYVGGPARPELAAAAAGPADAGGFDNVTLDGFVVSNSFKRLPESGWTAVVAVPTVVLNAPLRRTLALIGFAGAALTALGVGLATLMSRRIAEPLREISGAALALVEGREPPPVPVTIDELREVERAFAVAARLARDRVRAEQELRASEARFRGTFENAAVGMGHVALDGSFLMVNDRLCEILGHSREELLATTKGAITHPDDLPADRANVARLLSGEAASYSVEKRYLRKDGEAVWAGVTVSLLRGEAGKPDYMLGVVRDISARRHAQDHQHFLMRELSHRTKNLLAVIQAMARQTARGGGTHDEFLKRFTQRLHGIAASHDLLVNQNWQGVGLAELVRQQLAPFADAESFRLTIEGPPLAVTAEAAQSIGLALHELATNAVKYGALSVPAGRVAVSWRLDHLDGAEQVWLDWREMHGPDVKPPSQKGFGHFVTESMISQSLNGRVTVQFLPDGLHWSVVFSSSNLAKGLDASAAH